MTGNDPEIPPHRHMPVESFHSRPPITQGGDGPPTPQEGGAFPATNPRLTAQLAGWGPFGAGEGGRDWAALAGHLPLRHGVHLRQDGPLQRRHAVRLLLGHGRGQSPG